MNNPYDIAKVLDPREDESEFNFHLEFMDLLGMCARGSNVVTTNFCRGLFEDINSLIEPLADIASPLCIRAPILRFLHGVYFSDPKHKFYDDDKNSTLWDVIHFDDFKKMMNNMINDVQRLQYLLSRQSEIEVAEDIKED